MSCGVGCRRVSDPALLWLWCRPVATALIRPLAWEPPYTVSVALKHTNKRKPLAHSKSNYEREVNSNSVLSQERRKSSNKQPKLTPKATREERTDKALN